MSIIHPNDKRLLKYFCGPLVLVLLCLVLLIHTVGSHIPRDLSPAEWEEFVNYLFVEGKNVSPVKAVCVLLVMHVLHLVLCFPFLHLSNMLVGYYIGTLYGFMVCACFETFVIGLFVYMQRTDESEKNLILLRFIRNCRKRRMLAPALACVQLSSIPINSSVCLVLFGSISRFEFLSSHLFITIIMTFKNTFIGASIRTEHSPAAMRLCGFLVIAFSIIPTLMTIALSASVYATMSDDADDTELDIMDEYMIDEDIHEDIELDLDSDIDIDIDIDIDADDSASLLMADGVAEAAIKK